MFKSENTSTSVPVIGCRLASRCEMCNWGSMVPKHVEQAPMKLVWRVRPSGRALECASAFVMNVAISARVMSADGR